MRWLIDLFRSPESEADPREWAKTAMLHFLLGLSLEEDNPPPGSTVRIWGGVVRDREPTEQEWSDMFDWLSAKALKP